MLNGSGFSRDIGRQSIFNFSEELFGFGDEVDRVRIVFDNVI